MTHGFRHSYCYSGSPIWPMGVSTYCSSECFDLVLRVFDSFLVIWDVLIPYSFLIIFISPSVPGGITSPGSSGSFGEWELVASRQSGLVPVRLRLCDQGVHQAGLILIASLSGCILGSHYCSSLCPLSVAPDSARQLTGGTVMKLIKFCHSEQLPACRAPFCKSEEMTLPPFLGQMVLLRPAAEELSMCRFTPASPAQLLLCSRPGQFASRLPELDPQLQSGSLSLCSLAYVLWAHLSPGRCCGLTYILQQIYVDVLTSRASKCDLTWQ